MVAQAYSEVLLQELYSFDADYVRRLGDGDSATEDHFARYFGDLIRIKATVRLRSPQMADDVRQETLMRVLRSVRKGAIEHPERLGAYVNTVGNNVMLEFFRRDRRLNQLPENAEEISSGQPGADVEVANHQRREMVKRELAQLAPKDRELLRRVFLEEQNKDAVCAEFHVTRDYLRVLLHRARGRLRAAIQGRGRAAG
jgi:RNA polymerase sigma-70 factor (ECF subfamily)